MFRRPRFKPHLRVQVVPGDGVFLLSERHQVVLQGRLYEQVAPCLDGRTVEAICEQLRDRVAPERVFYTLAQLEKRHYLSEAEDGRPEPEAALWGELQVEVGDAARRLAETPVEVRAVGATSAEPLRELLQSLGVRTAGEPVLTVVEADSYLRDELRAVNEEALRAGRPWLLVNPVGRWVWLGPLFVPGKTGCWACLAERMRASAPILAYLDAKHGHTGEDAARRAHTPATLQVGRGLAATAVASRVGRGELPHLEGKVYTLDVLTGESQTHTLVRRPPCPVCGDPVPVNRTVQPVEVRSARKAYTEDGGHRVCTPQQTLERYGHHVSPITGAVSMLEKDAGGDGVLHVYLSGPNNARRANSLRGLREDLRSSNCGKGTTDAQAKASALCEGLERYSGTFRGDEPRRRARLASARTTACFSATGSTTSGTPGTQPGIASTRSRCRSIRGSKSSGRRSGRSAGRPSATCRRPTAGSATRSPRADLSVTPAPTATPPATRSRKPSCRAFWSWSSATAWPCGGTTGCAGLA
jgi:ribosomal protein S12 methylthiotransferase accessory factor